ncbi:unnamed protein product, partial [marine sediment metagenome]
MDFWKPVESKGIALKVCGRCGGAGGLHFWPGYTCFRCGGARYMGKMPITAYNEMVVEQEAKEAKRQATASRVWELTADLRLEWAKLMLVAFKAYTIFRAQGQQVDYIIYNAAKGGYSFPKGKWLRVATWEKKVSEKRIALEEALNALPLGWESYVADAPEPKYQSKWVGEIKKR